MRRLERQPAKPEGAERAAPESKSAVLANKIGMRPRAPGP